MKLWMKYSVTALFILAALAIVGTVMADEDGGEPLNMSLPGCPLPDEGRPIPDQLMSRARDCAWNEKFKIATHGAQTEEEYHRGMKLYCDELPTAYQCLNATNTLAEICVVEEFRPFVRIQGRFMMELAETVCRDEGFRFASLIQKMKPLQNASNSENVYHPCHTKAVMDVEKKYSDDVEQDVTVFSLVQFLLAKEMKECLIESNSGDKYGVDIAISLLEDFTKHAHCIDRGNPTDVLCESMRGI